MWKNVIKIEPVGEDNNWRFNYLMVKKVIRIE